MKEEAKKRLERLLQDLQEIQEASPKQILCAVISSMVDSPLRAQATWQWVAKFVRASRHEDDSIVLDPNPVVVEPFTDGKGCVRWCGQDSKRDAFKEWVTRLSGFCESNPELIPNAEPRYGIEGGLQALCAIAAPVPELSTLVKRRPILQLTGQRTLPPKTPTQIQKMKPRPSFDVMEIDVPVPVFALKVLNHLLGKPLRDPPIRVEINESPKHEFANVFVNGKPYIVEKVFALIVEQLVRANGNPISQRTITNNCPDLKKLTLPRFSRIFEKKQNKVPFEIEPSTKGFYLKPEWLQ